MANSLYLYLCHVSHVCVTITDLEVEYHNEGVDVVDVVDLLNNRLIQETFSGTFDGACTITTGSMECDVDTR